MKCGLCETSLQTEREKEVELCKICEIQTHGCSTGDCPHDSQFMCTETLAYLKAEQEGII